MNSIRAIQQLNKRELEAGINPEGSWHTDYRDTAFIYTGGLPFELSEGDIITIFSQYGEPVWIKLARDRETGKSRGFAWIKYEDQRSCDLAVDNLGGASIMDRIIRVDHARYKPKDDEDMRDNTMGEPGLVDQDNESDSGRRKRRKTESDSDSDEDRPLLPEEIELGKLMEKLDEDDPMRDSMIKRQQERVDEAVRKLKKQKQKEKERAKRKDRHSRRDRSRDRDRHRDKDRKRIKEEEEDRDHRHRSEKTRDRSEDSRDRRDRHRRRERRRSDSGEDTKPSRAKSSRSPLPYRTRSP